jgi:cobalamin synthase
VTESIFIIGMTAWFTGWRTGTAMIVASAAIVLLARYWFVRRLGGVNGDCLGATCQVVEMVNLVILAWQPSI